MSKIQTRREIADDLATAQAEVEAIRIERDESIEANRAELETVKADFQVQIDALTAKADEQVLKINDLANRAESAEASLIEANAKAVEFEAELATSKDALAKAASALKNPAVTDATMTNADGVLPAAQADAEADAAELAAKEAAHAAAPKNIVEQYEAMEQGPERVKFWNENKRKIMAHYDNPKNEVEE